jgi:hypothetical protein
MPYSYGSLSIKKASGGKHIAQSHGTIAEAFLPGIHGSETGCTNVMTSKDDSQLDGDGGHVDETG